MTYCVGLYLNEGLVLLSDTRTNAGVDHISTFGKMHVEEVPGERMVALLSAGNLAISQAVWNRLVEGVWLEGQTHTLRDVPTMFRAAQLVGAAVRAVFDTDGPTLRAQGIAFDVALLLGGQIGGQPQRLFMIYAAGNFIEATEDTPFLQIGEHKYGKPILDRAVTPDTTLVDGVKLALISMDSTLRSNLTVGMPLDLLVYRANTQVVALRKRITEDEPYFRLVREGWSNSLREAYRAMPAPDWVPG
ncbi:proteasome-type protease [Neoroseomonas oryzicola]|uniref:Proteasome-type protease n=1 Tax=Neoroseomonas oryzicola TaxID=535904 RepID=A0A9X9WMQ8_9PROT|nr:proteasome-type protease [Neoroseomonas oryzicola]MBR0661618.1 proteasome-type protease [Neoroseomonas oryzicola]NKE15848.1 proteasome-type protease [Neoroseomonas oryzicola]